MWRGLEVSRPTFTVPAAMRIHVRGVHLAIHVTNRPHPVSTVFPGYQAGSRLQLTSNGSATASVNLK
jgi:hypothetical protein